MDKTLRVHFEPFDGTVLIWEGDEPRNFQSHIFKGDIDANNCPSGYLEIKGVRVTRYSPLNIRIRGAVDNVLYMDYEAKITDQTSHHVRVEYGSGPVQRSQKRPAWGFYLAKLTGIFQG